MGQDRGDGRSRTILGTVGFSVAVSVSAIGIHGGPMFGPAKIQYYLANGIESQAIAGLRLA
jgi:hypothetical protein